MDDDENDKESGLSESTRKLLSSLTVREAKVLRQRFGIDLSKNHSLEEVGKQFDITRKRIEEIEAKALKKLKGRKKEKRKTPDLKCSFCGKYKNEVKKLVQADSGVTICMECIKMCTEIIENDED